MIMQYVDSSNLLHIGYDANSQTLRIEFQNHTVYDYFDVPPHTYKGLMGAPSHGGYHARHIKDVYRYRRIL
ncbi:KTSC domain-containing protein [Bacillus solitudinis]|uniref:KTSC domain-containing protein n=1 Tax=Bacillus solitudinis TaxID=2014074 RepID=UPI000C25038B|nr:KTSC domain-containing protein [Bacillus solitudinis]